MNDAASASSSNGLGTGSSSHKRASSVFGLDQNQGNILHFTFIPVTFYSVGLVGFLSSFPIFSRLFLFFFACEIVDCSLSADESVHF